MKNKLFLCNNDNTLHHIDKRIIILFIFFRNLNDPVKLFTYYKFIY